MTTLKTLNNTPVQPGNNKAQPLNVKIKGEHQVMSPERAVQKHLIEGTGEVVVSTTELVTDMMKLHELFYDAETELHIPVDYDLIKDFSNHAIKAYCGSQGMYVIPTTELCDWFLSELSEDKLKDTIEIGCGLGTLARDLGIRATDSKNQLHPDVIKHYLAAGQQPIVYPKDVIMIEAVQAAKKLKPKYVIGCYITRLYNSKEHHLGGSIFGVDEVALVKNVCKYYLVGTEHIHGRTSALINHPQISCIKHENIPGLLDRSLRGTIIYEFQWIG